MGPQPVYLGWRRYRRRRPPPLQPETRLQQGSGELKPGSCVFQPEAGPGNVGGAELRPAAVAHNTGRQTQAGSGGGAAGRGLHRQSRDAGRQGWPAARRAPWPPAPPAASLSSDPASDSSSSSPPFFFLFLAALSCTACRGRAGRQGAGAGGRQGRRVSGGLRCVEPRQAGQAQAALRRYDTVAVQCGTCRL